MRLNPVLLMTPLAALLLSSTAFAADNELQRCRAIADATARLGCYDALAASPAAALALAPPVAAKPAAPAAEEVESQIIGFDGWTPRTKFKLANGQVWQVADDSSGFYALKDPKVKVHRAAFGSFLMEIDGAGRMPRVRRVE